MQSCNNVIVFLAALYFSEINQIFKFEDANQRYNYKLHGVAVACCMKLDVQTFHQ